MSNPTYQRADGCSVFFTFLVLALLLSGFYLAQRTFEPEAPASVNEAIDSDRTANAQEHRVQNEKFLSLVDDFHAEQNTTIESSMKSVLQTYRAVSKAQPQPAK
ncbi:hypothetical protein OAV01_03025 [Opitutales bacterium]|nr:hypothetical protein [Opitutales bacterium]